MSPRKASNSPTHAEFQPAPKAARTSTTTTQNFTGSILKHSFRMTTIPSRLARVAQSSGGPEEARKRVIQLYRDWYRSVRSVLPLRFSLKHLSLTAVSTFAPLSTLCLFWLLVAFIGTRNCFSVCPKHLARLHPPPNPFQIRGQQARNRSQNH